MKLNEKNSYNKPFGAEWLVYKNSFSTTDNADVPVLLFILDWALKSYRAKELKRKC